MRILTRKPDSAKNVMWLDFSNDGSKLSATYLEHIDIWDLAQEKIITTIPRESNYFFDYAAFNPADTKILAVDNKAHIFDSATGFREKTFTHLERGDVMSARYNHTGDLVVTTHPRDIWVWDAHTGIKLQRFENHSLSNIKRALNLFQQSLALIATILLLLKMNGVRVDPLSCIGFMRLKPCALLNDAWRPSKLHY